MWTVLVRLGGVIVLAYLLFAVLLWLTQTRMVFVAPRAGVPRPEAYGHDRGEVVAVHGAGGVTLYGWFLPPHPPTTQPAPGLLWFYGNAETVAALAPVIGELQPPGYGLLLLDYRGYGQNSGSPTEGNLYRDAESAWEFLRTRPDIDSGRIAIYGRSLGSVPALYLAATRPVTAVILDSPFTSARAMARVHYPIFPSFLTRMTMDNSARASRVDAPVLVLHGTRDRIAPIAMGQALAERSQAGILVPIEGADHNSTYAVAGSRYPRLIAEFLADADPSERS